MTEYYLDASALVKRYADAHKARIHLTSEPGKGTRIEVRFPMS